MEISYYVECYENKEKFIPRCLTINTKMVDFTFNFTEENMKIGNSNLEENIMSILKICFGTMTVEISIIQTRNEQEIDDIEILSRKCRGGYQVWPIQIKAVRQPYRTSGELDQNLMYLLLNNKTACKQFLGNANDNCWSSSTKKIFHDNGISFLGHTIKDGPKMSAAIDG